MDITENTFLVEYADDSTVVIVAWVVELAQMRLKQVMWWVSSWMTNHALKLAAEKNKLCYLQTPNILPMQVGEETAQVKAAVKYLQITLDTKLIFWA